MENVTYRNFVRLSFAAAMLLMVGCSQEHEVRPGQSAKTSKTTAQGNSLQSLNSSFNYGQTIFYRGNSANVIYPAITPGGSGVYKSAPEGLSINAATGAIDLAASESGVTYDISYTVNGTQYQTSVLISGVDYAGSLFYVNQPDGELYAKTFYNDNLSLAAPTGSSFDLTVENGQSLAAQGVAINPVTGHIDMKQTLLNNALGTGEGANKLFRMYYKLNDNSQKTLNSIPVQIYHYSKLSLVPADVLERSGYTAGGRVEEATGRFPRRPRALIIISE